MTKKEDREEGERLIKQLRKNTRHMFSIGNAHIFPDLEEVAKEFAKKNNFHDLKITDYELPIYMGNEREGKYGAEYSGVILGFKEGTAILTTMRRDLEENLHGSAEMVFGGISGWVWERSYLLGGVLNNEKVSLRADYGYHRDRKQKVVRDEETGMKHIELALCGEVKKEIYRHDDSKLWFLCDSDVEKRGVIKIDLSKLPAPKGALYPDGKPRHNI